jgi:diaminopimelate epimerase
MSHQIKFYKYQGAGNDFIVIDNRNVGFDALSQDLIAKMCDRRFGIGADGLMLLQYTKKFDFEMLYYNADGREGSMCGNGGRCIVAFARDLGIITKEADFLAVDGAHRAQIDNDQVNLGMIDVNAVVRNGADCVLNTGSPHYVKVVDDLANYAVFKEGSAIRNNDTYRKEGINVNFVEREADGYFVRTFERGVEDETLACGTGATAAAIAMAIQDGKFGDVEIPIRVVGGQLYISFHREGDIFSNVQLKGPAKFVFEGVVEI